MWHLKPESPLGHLYEAYRVLGGDPHKPGMLPAGRLLRKLFLWLPVRWALIADKTERMPMVIWISVCALAIYNQVAAFGCLGLLGLLMSGPAISSWGQRLALRQTIRDIEDGCRWPVEIV